MFHNIYIYFIMPIINFIFYHTLNHLFFFFFIIYYCKIFSYIYQYKKKKPKSDLFPIKYIKAFEVFS